MEPHHHREEMNEITSKLVHKPFSTKVGSRTIRVVLLLLVALAIALLVRGLTVRFISAHLSDPAWFQSNTYAVFDKRAREMLDGKSSIFWIDNPAETDAAIYPPGYPLWIAFIYKLRGERSAASVQRVQWLLDSFSVLLIVGIGVTAYNWSAGLASGLLAALSPLLALYGATPMADAPASWIVLVSVWMLLWAVKRESPGWTVAAGLTTGASCWLRANALLLPLCWALVLLLLMRVSWRRKAEFSGLLVLGMALVVTPLLIRNAVIFRVLTPTGLGVGTNLWEGIGETDRAAEFGAVYGDKALMEQERSTLMLAPDAPFSLYYPEGVRRDRERARKALGVILLHPLWYMGVMTRRTFGMLKYAGTPPPYMGSAGINITSSKCLPVSLQRTPAGLGSDFLGMAQSVLRWLILPLALYGAYLSFRVDRLLSGLIFATVLYYLITLSAMHSELRYGLPMHAVLLVWAGLASIYLPKVVLSSVSNLKPQKT